MADDAAKKLAELVKKKRKPCEECARVERERKFGTESQNQYDRPVTMVIPVIPPPFVPPNYNAVYKRNMTMPQRFRDVDQALRDAQAQLAYYNDLRTKYGMTGLRGGPAASQASVTAMQDMRADAVARALMASRNYKPSDIQTAWAAVTGAAGAGQSTMPREKRWIIDEMVDVYGIPAVELKKLIDASPGGAIDPAALAPYFPAPPPPPPPPPQPPPPPPTPPTPAPKPPGP